METGDKIRENFIYDSLKKIFVEQTRVPEYELDNILFELAEYYRRISDKKIDSIIKYMIENRKGNIVFNHTVKMYIGDFLDNVSFAPDCDRLWFPAKTG